MDSLISFYDDALIRYPNLFFLAIFLFFILAFFFLLKLFVAFKLGIIRNEKKIRKKKTKKFTILMFPKRVFDRLNCQSTLIQNRIGKLIKKIGEEILVEDT